MFIGSIESEDMPDSEKCALTGAVVGDKITFIFCTVTVKGLVLNNEMKLTFQSIAINDNDSQTVCVGTATKQ